MSNLVLKRADLHIFHSFKLLEFPPYFFSCFFSCSIQYAVCNNNQLQVLQNIFLIIVNSCEPALSLFVESSL